MLLTAMLLASIPCVRSYAFDEYEDQILFESLLAQGYDSKVAFDEVWERKGQPDVYGTGGIDGISTYGTCSFDGTGRVIYKNSHTHSWDDGVVTKEASCSEEGIRTFTCSCGETKEEDIPLIEHTFEIDSESPATCISYRTVTYRCSVCGEPYTEEFSDEGYVEHAYSVKDDSIPATCEKAGSTHYVCDVCEDDYWEETIPLGHAFTKYTVDKEPLCTEDGIQSIHCDNEGCDAVEEGSEIAIVSTGHIENPNHEVYPASFWRDGLETIKCDICGETISEMTLPAKGGIFRYVIPIVSCLLAILIVFTVLKKKK